MKPLKSIIAVALTFSAIAANAGTSPLNVTSGNLDRLTVYSPELQADVTVDVWTPDGYTTDNRYPVIYMHDGQMLFDAASTWNHQAWEIDSVMPTLEGVAMPIVVGVHSFDATRIGDLMPTEVVDMLPKFYADSLKMLCPGGVRGDKYVDFVANTLKPLIDRNYATIAEADNTAVMGSSMGGLISVYALCRRPDVFGSAACLSTHWTGQIGENEVFPSAMAGYLVTHIPMDGKHKIYFDNGDQDIDIPYQPYFQRFNDLFRQMGYDDARLMTRFFPGQGHNERAWSSRVALPLTFVLSDLNK